MNIVTPEFIRDYMTENFSDIGRLSADSEEFVMESLFEEYDYKRHMSVNVDTGLWQCFKTGRSGNFIRLYSEAEGIPYFKAQRNLIIKNFEFLGEEVPELDRPSKELELDTSKLIPINLNTGNSEDQKELIAWSFLFGRKLFNLVEEEEEPFYLCNEGKFHNRIIIPYRSEGVVYFFQARTLYNKQPKYLNPSTEIAPKSSDILYPYDEDADHLVVCEGPLDARCIQLQGMNATCTNGSHISKIQADILSTFKGKLILGFDNDEAGMKGMKRFDQTRKELRMPPFYYLPLPKMSNDWNDAHMKHDLVEWIEYAPVLYDFEYQLTSQLSSL